MMMLKVVVVVMMVVMVEDNLIGGTNDQFECDERFPKKLWINSGFKNLKITSAEIGFYFNNNNKYCFCFCE